MKAKAIICTALALMAAGAMTGCGKKTFDVTDTLEVTFEGYDGYGICKIENGYDWIDDVLDWYGDKLSDLQQAKCEYELSSAVTYEADKKENLSNGDTVTVTAKIGTIDDDYKITLKSKEIKVTVEGLEEVDRFDPFENINVLFEGYAPNGKATIKNNGGDGSINFELDKTSGLSNGDTVKVTASTPYEMSEYARRYGKVFSTTEKEFTVDGLSRYASSLDDIPEDTKNKMRTQASDAIMAQAAGWVQGNKLKSSEFMGYYFLKNKEGFNKSPYNEVYCVYKNTAAMTGLKRGGDGKTQETGEEVYYTYYRYYDVMILPDGTCSLDLSKGSLTDNRIESDYGYTSFFSAVFYKFQGYKDLDSMFNDCVTKKIAEYDYENTVK